MSLFIKLTHAHKNINLIGDLTIDELGVKEKEKTNIGATNKTYSYLHIYTKKEILIMNSPLFFRIFSLRIS